MRQEQESQEQEISQKADKEKEAGSYCEKGD